MRFFSFVSNIKSFFFIYTANWTQDHQDFMSGLWTGSIHSKNTCQAGTCVTELNLQPLNIKSLEAQIEHLLSQILEARRVSDLGFFQNLEYLCICNEISWDPYLSRKFMTLYVYLMHIAWRQFDTIILVCLCFERDLPHEVRCEFFTCRIL